MLFLSCHAYQLTSIIPEHVDYHPTNGQVVSIKPAVNAEFFHGGAPNWAIEQALASPSFNRVWDGGLPPDQERRAMVFSFDTERQNYTPEEQERVEEFMLNFADYGTRYIRAIPPGEQLTPPWPNYDTTQWKQVPQIAKEIQVPYTVVLEYERTHKNRDALVEWLVRLIVEENPTADEQDEAATVQADSIIVTA